jgi:hypothetical protein
MPVAKIPHWLQKEAAFRSTSIPATKLPMRKSARMARVFDEGLNKPMLCAADAARTLMPKILGLDERTLATRVAICLIRAIPPGLRLPMASLPHVPPEISVRGRAGPDGAALELRWKKGRRRRTRRGGEATQQPGVGRRPVEIATACCARSCRR